MNIVLILLKNSLELDLRILKLPNWSLKKKFEFIAKKYVELLVLKSGVKKFQLGRSYINLFGKSVYYDSPMGLAIYQSMFVRIGKLIKDANLTKIKTIVDIGANVGFFSIMINEYFPNARVYSFEPIPLTFSCLLKNISGNPKIVPYELALSEKNGVKNMTFDENDSLISKFTKNKRGKKGESLMQVKTATLDNFCSTQDITDIDLLKIDAETFELGILKGSRRTLEKTRYLLLEITVEDNSNYTFSEIHSLLVGKRFNFQLIAFRNYAGKGEGLLTTGDFLYENINFSSN